MVSESTTRTVNGSLVIPTAIYELSGWSPMWYSPSGSRFSSASTYVTFSFRYGLYHTILPSDALTTSDVSA